MNDAAPGRPTLSREQRRGRGDGGRGGQRAPDIDLRAVQRVYGVYAPVYDASFGWVVARCQKRLVRSLSFASGSRVLEVGVGTGLSLPLYPDNVSVVGIDASQAMLARARARVERRKLRNVELRLGDAEQSGFEDASFDCVMLMFVLSVTPDPQALLREARRICRRGGHIYVLNHFSGNRGLGVLERGFAGLARWIGFRSDMPIAVLEDYADDIKAVEAFPPFGFFKLIDMQP
jgi:phosphatidylethanolamine/phosphatidyl-N-methylethanolamine N-methyltransferase